MSKEEGKSSPIVWLYMKQVGQFCSKLSKDFLILLTVIVLLCWIVNHKPNLRGTELFTQYPYFIFKYCHCDYRQYWFIVTPLMLESWYQLVFILYYSNIAWNFSVKCYMLLLSSLHVAYYLLWKGTHTYILDRTQPPLLNSLHKHLIVIMANCWMVNRDPQRE